MPKGFPGIAGALTQLIGKMLIPVWALLRFMMFLTVKLGKKNGK